MIPNAVDGARFTPDPPARSLHRVTVVCMNRLVYRKGVDLLVACIPLVCARCPQVDFLIGGDGPKRAELEAMIALHGLSERVTLLGDVAHPDVRSVLRSGHIFLSASLTESFGIAVLEAACCGMLVVATAVGGVPEVLPPHIMRLSPPSAQPLADAVAEAAEECLLRRRSGGGASSGRKGVGKGGKGAAAGGSADVEAEHAWAQHREVCGMYSWSDIAERVERVYDRAALHQSCEVDRLRRYLRCGPVSGPLFAFVAAADSLFCLLLSFIYPASQIDIAPDTHLGLEG